MMTNEFENIPNCKLHPNSKLLVCKECCQEAIKNSLQKIQDLIQLICKDDMTIERACEELKIPISEAVNNYPILWVITDALEVKHKTIQKIKDKILC